MIAAPAVNTAPFLTGEDDLDLHSNQSKSAPLLDANHHIQHSLMHRNHLFVWQEDMPYEVIHKFKDVPAGR